MIIADETIMSVTETKPSSPDADEKASKTPTSWDIEDDNLLMHLKDNQKLGWKAIASHFTNRTPNACQFRWRRLKSGNLKNPPKPGSGSPVASSPHESPPTQVKKPKKSPFPNSNPGGPFPSAYHPLSGSNFPNYDNNVSNALAGLNALSNESVSGGSGPGTTDSGSGSGTNAGHDQSPPAAKVPLQTTNNYQHTADDDISLDPSHHGHNFPEAGGYYADVSVDPTMNLPQNQHPHPAITTPRNSASAAPPPRDRNSVSGPGPHHHNSIIHISRDDRNSFSFTRDSVSSLPSKSMNIPHHQLNNNLLAHMPIMFGSNGSVSGGLSRRSSVSQSITVPSLRNGSVVGSGASAGRDGYFSRSGSVVIPFTASGDKKDDYIKIDRKELQKAAKKHQESKDPKKNASSSVLKLPWSMEEDELLINRRTRELSFAELSILLPQRTEGEIWARIDYLEKLRNGGRTSVARERRRRQSSIGLDDVEDFYMSDIGVTEDDDDDEVLVDVDDDAVPRPPKRYKRRTSSMVNPLTVHH